MSAVDLQPGLETLPRRLMNQLRRELPARHLRALLHAALLGLPVLPFLALGYHLLEETTLGLSFRDASQLPGSWRALLFLSGAVVFVLADPDLAVWRRGAVLLVGIPLVVLMRALPSFTHPAGGCMGPFPVTLAQFAIAWSPFFVAHLLATPGRAAHRLGRLAGAALGGAWFLALHGALPNPSAGAPWVLFIACGALAGLFFSAGALAAFLLLPPRAATA